MNQRHPFSVRRPSCLGPVIVFAIILLLIALAPHFALSAPDKTPVVFTNLAKTAAISDRLTFPARVDSSVDARIIADSDGVVLQIVAPLGNRIGRRGKILVLQKIDPGFQYAPMAISSPVAGVISQIKVSVGSQVVKGQELAAVTDPSKVRIRLEVSALDLPVLHNGVIGQFKMANATAKAQSIPVKMVGLSPVVDPVTGTATAELVVDNTKKGTGAPLIPGSVGQVHFDVNKRNGFLLPDHAIVYKGDETWIRLLEGKKSKQRLVKLGVKREGLVEILEGLKEGDEVIERASSYVADGAEVKKQDETKAN